MLLKKEFTSHIKSAFIIILVVSLLMFLELSEFNGTSQGDFEKFVDAFPKIIKAMFGFSDYNFTKISGIYAVMMLYVVIPIIIYCINLGVKITSKLPSNDFDFIYVSGYSRKKIYIKKVIANVLIIFAITSINLLLNILFLKIYKETNFTYVLLINVNLLITCLLFFSLGLMFSSIMKNSHRCFSILTIIVLVLYFLNVLTSLFENLDFFKYMNPLNLYCNNDLIENNNFNFIYFGVCIGLSIILTLSSYFTFKRRDL